MDNPRKIPGQKNGLFSLPAGGSASMSLPIIDVARYLIAKIAAGDQPPFRI